MGFTPGAIDDMSLWQFMACLDGWRAANGGEQKPAAPSVDEFRDMMERLG